MSRGTRRWMMVAGIVAFAVIAFAIMSPPGLTNGLFIRVPGSHDQRLVGVWLSEDETHVITGFRPDGTGWSSYRRSPHGKFQWGTDEGMLFTKRMQTDYWSAHRWKYALDLSGATATFLGDRSDLVRFHMRRATARDLAAFAPRLGESREELFATLGPPDSNSDAYDNNGDWVFTYTWPRCRVTVSGNRVTRIEPR